MVCNLQANEHALQQEVEQLAAEFQAVRAAAAQCLQAVAIEQGQLVSSVAAVQRCLQEHSKLGVVQQGELQQLLSDLHHAQAALQQERKQHQQDAGELCAEGVMQMPCKVHH